MEAWEKVFREGFAVVIPTEGLQKLLKALEEDLPTLTQGSTTTPPPLMCVQDWPVEAACAVAYCGWGEERTTVGEVEEFFARACFDADRELGEPASYRWFLNWFDDTPRDEMRLQLIRVITSVLTERAKALEGKV